MANQQMVIEHIKDRAEAMAVEFLSKKGLFYQHEEMYMVKELVDRCIVHLILGSKKYYSHYNSHSAMKDILFNMQVELMDSSKMLFEKEWEYVYYLIHRKLKDGVLEQF